ncbi:hypothetical protein AB1Y20_012533 [Prymnesium parvum]|uniref:DUF1275 domain-containing protein n=1 Tax=Prymnesium parvum TaxID=97485 RepID=A0AB34IKX1_PRYPA
MSRVALAAALALLSGFADVVCLLRFSAFAALQTGNIVHIGLLLAKLDRAEPLIAALAFSLAVLSSHFLAVFLFCAVAEHVPRPLLASAPLLGLLTAACGALDAFSADGCQWAVCLAAASFGVMNFCTSPNTPLEGRLFTMVSLATGNLQKCARALYRCARGHAFTPREKEAAQVASAVVLGTFAGAALAGVLSEYTGVHVPLLLLPVGAGQCAVLLLHDRVLRPSAHTAALTEPLAPAAPAGV